MEAVITSYSIHYTKVYEEARHIAKVIKELYLKGAYKYKDMGILYRVNLQSRAIEDSLREMGLPYHIIGSYNFV